VNIVTEVMAFIVNVPVLSLLITVVPPSVSTSLSDFTTALASASRCAPDESINCTNVGRPVGMAEIAVEMQSSTRVSRSWSRAMPKIAMMATAPQARNPKIFVRPSSSTWSGDFVRLVAVTMLAIWPIWVDWPVATTTSSAEPRVTCVFWNTRLVRSPSGCSSSARVVPSLAIGADSPVSDASWTSSDAEVMMRASAGTRSPASTSRMSPGTRPTASTSSTVPSRRTRAVGTCNWASASTLAIALRSWLVPMMTLNSTSAITMVPVAI
jgi:hypothetical protein